MFKLDIDSVILLTNKNRYHIEALNVLRILLTMINKQPNVQEKILGISVGFLSSVGVAFLELLVIDSFCSLGYFPCDI